MLFSLIERLDIILMAHNILLYFSIAKITRPKAPFPNYFNMTKSWIVNFFL